MSLKKRTHKSQPTYRELVKSLMFVPVVVAVLFGVGKMITTAPNIGASNSKWIAVGLLVVVGVGALVEAYFRFSTWHKRRLFRS